MEIVGNKATLPPLSKLPRIKQALSLVQPKPFVEKQVENNFSLRVVNDADVGCSPLPPLIQSRNMPISLLENIKSHQIGPENSDEKNMKRSMMKVSRGRETENSRRISRVIKNVSVKREGVESENPTSRQSLGPIKPKTALKSLDLNEGVKAMIKIQEAKPEKEEQNDISACEHLEIKKKKKKKILTALKDMVPLNLNEERETFFKLAGNYNPVFQYKMGEDLNQKFSQAHTSHLKIAEKILQECIKEFGDDENYIEISGGKLSTQADIEARFAEYVKELELEKYLKLAFSDKIVSSACCLYKWKGKGVIVISLPITHREKRILSVLDHEIGTHSIRKFNERKQPWAQNRNNYNLKNCLVIEEGLAMLNQTLEEAENSAAKPYLYSAALHYYACYKASILSFQDLYKDLEKYIKDPMRRWKECIRVKRGIVETEKPGGMYKDQVYLRGAIKILQNRKNIDFTLLHAGKLNLEDLSRMIKGGVIKTDKMRVPYFLKDLEKYKTCLDRIASFNFIDTLNEKICSFFREIFQRPIFCLIYY